MPTRRATGLRLWVAMAVIYVVWGSTYFGIAIAIRTIPPFFMAATRFVLAGGALLAWDLLSSREARRWPSRRELVDSAIVGTLLLGIGNGFVALGERTVPSGIAAILIGLIPVWFAILGWAYFHERPRALVGFGIVLGFAGVAALVWPIGRGSNQLDAFGIVVLLIAPIGWSHGSVYAARKAHLPSRPATASGLQMLFASIVLALEGVLTGEPSRLNLAGISTESVLGVLYLAVFGSMLAFTTYGWLLRHAPLSLVSTYAYVNPVVAVALGTLFLGETISPRTLFASGVIVAAVAIIVTARGRERAKPAADAQATLPAASAGSTSATPTRPSGLSRLSSPPRPRSG